MSKTIIIAEKPSVAQDIVRALTTPKEIGRASCRERVWRYV